MAPNDDDFYAPGYGMSCGVGTADVLRRALAARAATTVAWRPASRRDLEMAADGSLPGGLRFTRDGLEQFCGALVPGLHRLVASSIASGPAGLGDAVAAYNAAVRRRFDPDAWPRVFWRDDSRGALEGLALPGAGSAGAAAVFAEIEAEVGRSGRRVVFVEGSVRGRRFAARYADRAGAFRGPDGVARHAGVVFVGSEAIGEAAARAAIGAYAPDANAWLTVPGEGWRARRRGSTAAAGDVGDAIRDGIAAEVPMVRLRRGLEALAGAEAVPAGRGGRVKEAVDAVARAFAKRGASGAVVREVVVGLRFAEDASDVRPEPEAASWLDVCNAVACDAPRRHHGLRERIEAAVGRLAFRGGTRRGGGI